jgi:glycosyltransferase involved in cell wall biosynthesis
MSGGGVDSRNGLIKRLRRRWRERDLVTICLPAYNSADVIAETLQSISVQTYRNIRVLISLDPSDDGTDEVCRPFLADPRFNLIRQPTRLGWPGNVNYLLDQVRSKYYFIIFHDDLIEPDYIARLMRCLRRSPETLCAYPLLKHFGRKPSDTSVVSLEGGHFERALGFFAQPLNSVPIRGLTRIEALRRGLRLRELGTGGFLAETLYCFELALLGNCKRVGRAIYHSRYRPDSVSKGWRVWSDERKRAGWRRMLQTYGAIARRQSFTHEQLRALLEAALPWAYQLPGWLPADSAERAAIADPVKRTSLALAWADDPEGNPPFL